MGYLIIVGLNVEDTQEQVNEYLSNGYSLVGGIALFHDGKFAQAVVKETKDNE